MENILEKIVAKKKEEIVEQKSAQSLSQIENQALKMPSPSGRFKKAIENNDYKRMRVIAEVKKASPSKGVIDPNFDPYKTAQGYADNGADAVSVLTDTHFFQGQPEYLQKISETHSYPTIRKDFILEEYQILQARAWGASAFLLIVDCLDPKTLERLILFGQELGLDALVEAHRKDEVLCALDCGAQIIGVNNRNLRTFETNLQTSLDLRPLVPESIPFVSESGINQVEQVKILLEQKVSAVLVGEAFMRNPDFLKIL